MKENIDYVICPICHKQLKHINNMHVKQHNLTTEEFKKQFPNQRMNCEKSSIKRSMANRQEMLNIHNNSNKDYLNQRYHNISLAQQKRWDSCSDEYKKVFGKKATVNLVSYIKNRSDEEKLKVYSKVSDSIKQYYSKYNYTENDILVQPLSDKLNLLVYDLQNKHKRYLCIFNNTQYLFKSKAEIYVAKYLYDNNIEFEYESLKIQYIRTDNTKHLYIPDFYLPQINLLIEVKGKYYMNEDDQLKWDKAKADGYNHYTLFYKKYDIMLNELEMYLAQFNKLKI